MHDYRVGYQGKGSDIVHLGEPELLVQPSYTTLNPNQISA